MSAEAPAPARPSWNAPFVVFGLVALLAAGGAVYEISYWVGVPAFTGALLGTTVGILAALVAFFAWGLYAPPND